jgi:hypothetical protein
LNASEEFYKDGLQPLPLVGYRAVANGMANEGSTWPIFRRFGDLQILNLLTLQAELVAMHEDLRNVFDEDDQDANAWMNAFSIRELISDELMKERIIDMRRKLQEYSASVFNIFKEVLL